MRSESVKFVIGISHALVAMEKDAVTYILGKTVLIEDGDTVKLTYKIDINYFGEVAKKLDAILKLKENGAKVEYTELLEGRSIILELGNKINKIIGDL